MEKGNLKRIIFWGALCFIAVVCTVVGIISFNQGHGDIGKIMYQTKPIVKTFNNLNGLTKYENAGMTIEAKAKDDKVEVTYKSISHETIYTFVYEEIGSYNVLKINYDQSDKQNAQIVTEFMIDSVSIINGHKEGEIFKVYELDHFLQTTIDQGITVKDNDTNTRTVYINMNKSILDSNVEIKSDEEIEEENIEKFIENTKKIFSTSLYEFQTNKTSKFYNKDEKGCTVTNKTASPLKIDDLTGINYHVEIDSNGEITVFHASNTTYAITFIKTEETHLNLEDIGSNLPVISKGKDEESYTEIINEINNYCK